MAVNKRIEKKWLLDIKNKKKTGLDLDYNDKISTSLVKGLKGGKRCGQRKVHICVKNCMFSFIIIIILIIIIIIITTQIT